MQLLFYKEFIEVFNDFWLSLKTARHNSVPKLNTNYAKNDTVEEAKFQANVSIIWILNLIIIRMIEKEESLFVLY